jgi:polar amino acid transport system permease protein
MDLSILGPSWFSIATAVGILPDLLVASQVTVLVTVLAFAFSIALGLPFYLSRIQPILPLALVARFAVDFVRSTPLLLQVYFYYFGLPSVGIVMTPIVTGIVAMSVYYGCYMSEVYRSAIESLPGGQWDAAKALNFTSTQTYRDVVLPQLVPQMIPAAGNYLIAMIKDTPLLASISMAEIMFVAMGHGADTFQYLEPITTAGVIYLVLSLIASLLIRIAERFIGRKWRI